MHGAAAQCTRARGGTHVDARRERACKLPPDSTLTNVIAVVNPAQVPGCAGVVQPVANAGHAWTAQPVHAPPAAAMPNLEIRAARTDRDRAVSHGEPWQRCGGGTDTSSLRHAAAADACAHGAPTACSASPWGIVVACQAAMPGDSARSRDSALPWRACSQRCARERQ